MKYIVLKRWFVALSLMLVSVAASAQSFSNRPIRMIVPFAAGGANDLLARALSKPLGDALGTNVVVTNLAGGSTKIGVSELMRSPPDGHTLMYAGYPALLGYYYSGIYDTKFWQEMTVLGQTGRMAYAVFETRAESPFKTWKDVIAFGKENPGKLSVGGPAQGGLMNLIPLEIGKAAGIDLTYVPYRGGGPSGLAMLGGEIQMRIAQLAEVYPNAMAGKGRALAVISSSRIPEMPDVPTLKEVGFDIDIPPFSYEVWGPGKMPAAIESKITEAIKAAVKDPFFTDVARRVLFQPGFVEAREVQEGMLRFEKNIGPRLEAAFPRKPQ